MSTYEKDIHSIAKSLEKIDKTLWELYLLLVKEDKNEQCTEKDAEKES